MNEEYLNALPNNYQLEEYSLVRVLGAGGFGITYLGFDNHLEKPVAIKEYLPNDLAVRQDATSVMPKSSSDEPDFQWGLDRFLAEARTLAQFDHPNLVKVHRFFRANGTGYIVMEYVEGETLTSYLEQRDYLDEVELRRILEPILDGVQRVHAAGFLHRDIKPSNIVIRDDGRPVLIDFGAARQALGAKSRSVTSIVTPGYAPIEQYATTGEQGPWTDIYGLGAVCYRALTGTTPDDATGRVLKDPLVPAVEAAQGRASPGFLAAVDQALEVDQANRPQDIETWRRMLSDEAEPARPRAVATGSVSAPSGEPAGKAETKGGSKEGAGKSRFWIFAGAFAGVLLILGAVVLTLQPDAALEGTLTVETEPTDARVELDGVERPYESGMKLPAGEYVLRVSREGYRAESRKVTVAKGENRFSIGLTPLLARVAATANVDEARVVLDGRDLGPADGTAHEYPAGTYALEVRRDGYRPFRTEVELDPGETLELGPDRIALAREAESEPAPTASAEEEGTVEPEPVVTAPPVGNLVVRSNVVDDALYIDGEPVGSTGPTRHELSPGVHVLEVRKQGHETWRRSIRVKGGETERLRAVLTAEPQVGQLVVRSNIAGSRVLIDGVNVGDAGPDEHEVDPGVHEISVSRNGYKPWTRSVTVSAGETSTIRASLDPISTTGRLAIEPNVTGGRLFVNGKELGVRDSTVVELPAGRYKLKLRKRGYREWSGQVRLQAGETKTVAITLERMTAQGRAGSAVQETEPEEAESEYTGANEPGVPFAPQKQ